MLLILDFIDHFFYQEFERNIKAQEHALSVLSLQKHGTKAELADLVRTRTELECIIEDLKVAGQKDEKRRFVNAIRLIFGTLMQSVL